MPSFGSSTAPAFAGWQWIGTAEYAFAGKFTSPAFDVYITTLHAYFDTFAGNGALGYLCVWSGDDAAGNPLLAITSSFVINNGSKSAGGQQWWSHALGSPLFVPANTPLWLGAYSSQGILWSTYDTSPHTFDKAMGATINPSYFNSPYRSDTGQGPPGAYADYSQVLYASVATSGNRGGGLIASAGSIVTISQFDKLGTRNPGGLLPFNAIVRSAGTATLGGVGGGLAPTSTSTKVPKIWVWRP